MDQDRESSSRFCWPAKDRARAYPPITAPRTSPVFTASVFLCSDSVPGPRLLSLLSSLSLWARSATAHGSRNKALDAEVGRGCGTLGYPRQSLLRPVVANQSFRFPTVPRGASRDGSVTDVRGVALGFSIAKPGPNSLLPTEPPITLDWRIFGEQDCAEQF